MTITLSRFNVAIDDNYKNNVYAVLKGVFLDTRTPFSAWLVTDALRKAVGDGINIDHEEVRKLVHLFMSVETKWIATDNGQHIVYSPMSSSPSAAKFSFIDSGDTVAPGTQPKSTRKWLETPAWNVEGGHVVSSWIKSVEWFFDSEAGGVLEVTMNNGDAYQYFGVGRDIFDKVYRGDYKVGISGNYSVGRAYDGLVKGKFESIKHQ